MNDWAKIWLPVLSGAIQPEGESTVFGFRRQAKASNTACSHERAVPRWDAVEDAGKLDRISSYYCPACDQFLPPDAVMPRAVPPAA